MMINLFNNFSYYQDFDVIDVYDMIMLFDNTVIFDLMPNCEALVKIQIKHCNVIYNNIILCVDNDNLHISLNNYETMLLILKANVFLKNRRLKINE